MTESSALTNTDVPEVVPSEYRVLPAGYIDSPMADIDKSHFEVRVVWRGASDDGNDRWAVIHHGRCLNGEGDWEYESSPSNRTDDFLTRCRFSREEAIHRAVAVVDTITLGGRNFAQFSDWVASENTQTEETGTR